MSSTIWSMKAVACGISVGQQASECVHRRPPLGLVLFGDLFGPAVLLVRLVDDLVVDVGDVRDVVDGEPRVLEEAAEDVIDKRETAVADVGRSVHGRAADVMSPPGPRCGSRAPRFGRAVS